MGGARGGLVIAQPCRTELRAVKSPARFKARVIIFLIIFFGPRIQFLTPEEKNDSLTVLSKWPQTGENEM